MAPISWLAFEVKASDFRSNNFMYTKNDGSPNVVPIIDAGYPNATCPRETRKQIKKLYQLNWRFCRDIMAKSTNKKVLISCLRSKP